jgi:hypothetical protein
VTVPAWVRFVGWILGDLATAVVGANILGNQFSPIFHSHSFSATVAMAVGVAMVLGFAVFALLPHETAKWLWLVAIVLVASRAIYLWQTTRLLRMWGMGESVLENMWGSGCHAGYWSSSCQSFIVYTLSGIRMASYSVGALLASRFRRRAIVAFGRATRRFEEAARGMGEE